MGECRMTTKESHRRAWKRNESDIAKYISGQRVPITGRQRGDVPDIKHSWLAIEAKLRMKISGWIKDGMNQAEEAKRGHQMPALIIREKGQRVGDALICFRLKDFRDRWL